MSLGDAGEDGTAKLQLSMVSQHAVNDEIDLALVNVQFAQQIVQVIGRHVDVTEQETILQLLSLHIVLAQLAPIVEEDADDEEAAE